MLNYCFALVLRPYAAGYKGKKVIFRPLSTLRMALYAAYIKVKKMTFIPLYPGFV
ncbi:hypothetical protein HanXRQr2_Chr13g0609481 [Helianthus annuus]|uniref:Uncharacterized protein n=1 Tax=Helianthus annuus TaxID=4232 RepID=A0A251SVR0_HELAN|nr:hypothetical protein HanXRQr2_Chr13g0609481 [Helianthus annuus]